MNKRVMGGVLAALGLALLPAMATPAAATQEFQHTQDSKVLATTLELYTDYKYDTNWLHGGLVRYYTSSSPDLKAAGITDTVSSLKNTTNVSWLVYEHQDYKGLAYCIKPGQQIPDMRARNFNDKMSSVARLTLNHCVGLNPW